jgi:hypothetical protein
VLQRDAKEKRRKGGGKEAGNREAHAGNRADPATQADAEHSRCSKSHTAAQTNRNKEEEQPHTAQARKVSENDDNNIGAHKNSMLRLSKEAKINQTETRGRVS